MSSQKATKGRGNGRGAGGKLNVVLSYVKQKCWRNVQSEGHQGVSVMADRQTEGVCREPPNLMEGKQGKEGQGCRWQGCMWYCRMSSKKVGKMDSQKATKGEA